MSDKPDPTSEDKVMTLRLPGEQADLIEYVARVRGGTISHEVRLAIMGHVERLKKDEVFQRHLKALIEREREILDRLATDD